jgi:hypothetical protein|tara:strand:- start:1397 stop:1591 length:195 start_codon:yes stop_codon:yes gene_type:complete
MEYNKHRAEKKECYDNLMFLKDLRGEIPHDFKMSSNLKKADKMIVSEIKFWEDKILRNRIKDKL